MPFHTQVRPPGTNYPRASASCKLHLSNINSRHFFLHSVITLQTDCVYWLFTTDFSFIDNVMHLCSWPHCNRRTINSFMMMTMMMIMMMIMPLKVKSELNVVICTIIVLISRPVFRDNLGKWVPEWQTILDLMQQE